MGKQVTATVLVFLFCLLYTVAIVAQEQTQRSSKGDTGSVKAEVSALGFGKRVHVKLKNGEKKTGRITGFAQDHFVVTDSKGAAAAVAYTDVFRVTKQREKLGVFDKPWKGIMFTAAVVSTVIVMTMGWFD